MIYTSGTTGKPKGAVRTRGGGDPVQLEAMVRLFGWQPDDVYLTTGPLYHSGPGGFLGLAQLLGNTAVLQRVFDAEDWHTVGDIAYFDEDGFYYICDRKMDMIISGGVNIYPAEVEHALELHADILEAAVFGIPSEEWGESVHAVIVGRAGSEMDAAAVQAFAREHLAGYKIPRSVAFTGEIPKTGSGKILKRELRAPFWEERSGQVV